MATSKLPVPNTYEIKSLIDLAISTNKEIDGRWVPCRPLGYHGLSLIKRLRAAWLVFTGRADAVKWHKQ